MGHPRCGQMGCSTAAGHHLPIFIDIGWTDSLGVSSEELLLNPGGPTLIDVLVVSSVWQSGPNCWIVEYGLGIVSLV
jgi:hypothetical protein